ncbi:7652_t:CDS:2, partial [Racocetra fulgida]
MSAYPTDTTNPAFPESPTLPPDNNVSEDPRLSISPNNPVSSSITQQTSSSNQPNQRGPTPAGSQSPIVTVTTATRRHYHHHGGGRKNYQDPHTHMPQAPPVPPAPAPSMYWSKMRTHGNIPSRRRAHTTAYYNNCIYVFGGGDGVRALNDVYKLDISDMNNLVWQKLETTGRAPISRGYHTSNLVGNKLVVYGGSDGHECFDDVFMLDLETIGLVLILKILANGFHILQH